MSADPSGVAMVAESQLPGSSRGLLDVVFIATEPVLGREHGREAGLVPRFVRPDQMAGLRLHPPFAAKLIRLTDRVPQGFAAYVRNPVRPLDPDGSAPDVTAETEEIWLRQSSAERSGNCPRPTTWPPGT